MSFFWIHLCPSLSRQKSVLFISVSFRRFLRLITTSSVILVWCAQEADSFTGLSTRAVGCSTLIDFSLPHTFSCGFCTAALCLFFFRLIGPFFPPLCVCVEVLVGVFCFTAVVYTPPLPLLAFSRYWRKSAGGSCCCSLSSEASFAASVATKQNRQPQQRVVDPRVHAFSFFVFVSHRRTRSEDDEREVAKERKKT